MTLMISTPSPKWKPMKKPSKRGAPKGNQNAAKGETERLPWRLPVEWGIREAIEAAAKAQKLKPAEVLKMHFGEG